MARKIIDLSVVLDDTIPADPPNLEALPATGFDIMAFPVKVAHASAGWCRAAAVFND